MNTNDSFNDSDEVFNLYSSKKVTDTFKAELKKIAKSNYLTNAVSSANDEDFCTKRKIHPVEKKQKVDAISGFDSPEILVYGISDTPVGLKDENSLEDSIEIISEITPRSTRRSERLRKKRQLSSGFNHFSDINSSTTFNTPTTRGRKRTKKNKKKEGKILEEVTIEDSPPLIEQDDDELNPEISVKVIWKSVNVKKFKMRKFQKLSHIFEELSKEENIPQDKIMLSFNNVRVNPRDTPDSLNLQVYHFLDGGVLSELSNNCQTPNSYNSKCDSDSVLLKFQDANKKIIKLNLKRKDKLKVGMIKCSEQLEVPLNKIKFYFDGELLEPSETPESLSFENEEVIDIKIF